MFLNTLLRVMCLSDKREQESTAVLCIFCCTYLGSSHLELVNTGVSWELNGRLNNYVCIFYIYK